MLAVTVEFLDQARQTDARATRRESPDNMIAIDRDPVPGRYSELVRRYYERLGSD